MEIEIEASFFISSLFWSLARRAEETTNGIEADIMASYELLTAAADRQDAELFRSLHAHTGHQTSWGYSPDKLMTSESQLWNGHCPGITPLTASPQVAEIILASPFKRDGRDGLAAAGHSPRRSRPAAYSLAGTSRLLDLSG